ncbi:colicin E1 family microcin immunity protein [Pantoea wallisii]
MVWYISIFNTFLYPFSKEMVETIALKYTTREYWHRGIWYDTPAKNPVYATYYIFCYLIAIPASAVYFLMTVFSKKGHS